MLTTFENAGRQHMRRKERERNLKTIENIGQNSLFLCLEETNLAPAADALNGVSLAKTPIHSRSSSSSGSSRTRHGTKVAVVIGVLLSVLLATLLSLKVGKQVPEVTPRDGNTNKDTKKESARYNHLFSLVLDWQVTTRFELEDSESAAGKALLWLAFEDTSYDNVETLRSRFALATLYYSTHGEKGLKWTSENHWLSAYPVCMWHGVECLDDNDEIGLVKAVNLSANGLEGTLPRELSLLQRDCRLLDLSDNKVGGTIPDLSALVNLQSLYLGPNELVSSIPATLYELTHLTHLYMNDCILTGGLSSRIGKLTDLQGLGTHGNLLSGSIPSEIALLEDLRVLYLDENLFSGTVPSFPSGLIDLRLSHNRLRGNPFPSLANTRFIQILYLDNNEFNGEISGEILARMPILLELHAYNNRFSGPIPSELTALALLSSLHLDGNLLTGELPEIQNLRYLRYLRVDYNAITGSIPTSIGQLRDLLHLTLSQNNLNGELPSEIGLLSNLESIYVNNNTHLSGTIPLAIQKATKLRHARFHGCNFTGTMPEGICARRNSGGLFDLTSDCNTDMSCSCCTKCYGV